MAEFLIKARGNQWMEQLAKESWATKNLTQEQYDARSEKGDVAIVRPDGHPWGNKECPPDFVIIKVPGYEVKREEIEQGLNEQVLKTVTTRVSAEEWDKTYSKGKVPKKSVGSFASVPEVVNTIHDVGGITSYEVTGDQWQNKLRKKRLYHIPHEIVDQALELKDGVIEMKEADFLEALNKRELDETQAIVSVKAVATTLTAVKIDG